MTNKRQTGPVCYFANEGEGACSEKIDPEGDFCHGCKKLICEAHSRNMTMGHGHDPEDHLKTEEEIEEEL